jgi:K+ transporter
MKVLRKEKTLLKINLITLLFSILGSFFSIIVFDNLNLTIILIVFVLTLRSTVSETILSNELGIKIEKKIMLENMLTIVFMISHWYIDNMLSSFIYFVFYVIYISLYKKEIFQILNTIIFQKKGKDVM